MDEKILGIIVFVSLGALFTGIELLRPARPINYRTVIKNDLIALATYAVLFVLAVAVTVTNRVPVPEYVPDVPLPPLAIFSSAAGLLGIIATDYFAGLKTQDTRLHL